MHSFDTLVMNAIREQRAAKLNPGGRRAFGPGTTSATGRLAAAQTVLETDVDVLNYALTLEHLEAAFYTLTGEYDLGTDPFGNSINEYMTLAGEQEATHAATLTDVITQLGGEPVLAAEYDFGVTDSASFLTTAAVLENLGVSAYNGAGQFLQDPMLVEAAGTIVANEARHASYANLVIGDIPFPDAYETPATPDEVLEAAGPLIVQ